MADILTALRAALDETPPAETLEALGDTVTLSYRRMIEGAVTEIEKLRGMIGDPSPVVNVWERKANSLRPAERAEGKLKIWLQEGRTSGERFGIVQAALAAKGFRTLGEMPAPDREPFVDRLIEEHA